MKKINSVAGLILLICMTFGCQTLRVQEATGPKGPEGIYLAKTSTPNGEVEFTMIIKGDGSGSIKSMMGDAEFSGAKIDGNNFTFNVTMNSQMGEMALSFEGAIDGDNISGNIGTQMGALPFSGQRKS